MVTRVGTGWRVCFSECALRVLQGVGSALPVLADTSRLHERLEGHAGRSWSTILAEIIDRRLPWIVPEVQQADFLQSIVVLFS